MRSSSVAGPLGAGDLPFGYRAAAVAGREATQLRHFSSRPASANSFAQILAELLHDLPHVRLREYDDD
jgi:hypothetical protein